MGAKNTKLSNTTTKNNDNIPTKENNNIEIMYKKQIKYGEPITCIYTMEENQNIVTIKSQDEKTLHAIVKLY